MNVYRDEKAIEKVRRIGACSVLAAAVAGVVLSGCAGGGQQATNTAQTASASHEHEHGGGEAGGHEHGSGEAQATSTGASGEHKYDDERVALGQHTHDTWMEFISRPKQMVPGGLAIWNLNIWQKGKPATKRIYRVAEFKQVHDKLMHLIIVSKDLSYFNHVHPDHKGDGLFIIEQMLPRAGTYKVYADYTPLGGQQEVAQHELTVAGQAPAPQKLVPDVFAKGTASKRVVSRPEGQPEATGGDTYTVQLVTTPDKLVANQSTELAFRVLNAQGQPVKDLQPYLGAMGHAVILSSDTKIYLHTHPEDDVAHEHTAAEAADPNHAEEEHGGPDVMFHTLFPSPGLYKVWGQFQHNGRIITAPFVLNVGAALPSKTSSGGKTVVYTCPMHPDVKESKPGNCPKCGMHLVKA